MAWKVPCLMERMSEVEPHCIIQTVSLQGKVETSGDLYNRAIQATSAASGEPDEAGCVSSGVRGEVRASALLGLAGLAMDSRSWESAEERLTEVCVL